MDIFMKKDEKILNNRKHHAIRNYLVVTFFWLLFIGMLIAAIILFTTERTSVNSANNVDAILNQIATAPDAATATALYKQLMAIKYPLIDFALMSFVIFGAAQPISDWGAAWQQRVNNINIAYSYLFITALIAIIGLMYYLIIIWKIYRRNAFERHYELETNYPNNFSIFDSVMYMNFIVNLAIVFGFFNFLSTLIVLAYGIIMVICSLFGWYILRLKGELLVPRKWWTAQNFKLFLVILLIQNGYNIVKVIFLQQFNVNLDLILTILFPIGTITVMITLLIRNMLSTKVSAIQNAIKNINKQVTSFRVFYYNRKAKALEDFTFVSALPPLVKKQMGNASISPAQIVKLLTLIEETSQFFEHHYKKPKERSFMLYLLFNEIVDTAEIDEIKNNIIKIETKRDEEKKLG